MKTSTLLRSMLPGSLLMLLTMPVDAQDTLYLHNGRALAVKVEEIGLDEIKYSDPASGLKLVMVLDKAEVERVKLAGGTEMRFTTDQWGVAFSDKVMKKTHVVKMDMLSPVFNHLVFGYEQVIKPWMNFEGKLGVIGVGMSKSENDYSGVMLKAGMKFISRPEYVLRGMKQSHPLAGRYVKPEIIFNTYSTTFRRTNSYWDNATYTYVSTSHKETVHRGNLAFNVVMGRQRFLGQGVTLDTFVGLGFGEQWNDRESAGGNDGGEEAYAFSHLFLGKGVPLVISAGMTLGVAF